MKVQSHEHTKDQNVCIPCIREAAFLADSRVPPRHPRDQVWQNRLPRVCKDLSAFDAPFDDKRLDLILRAHGYPHETMNLLLAGTYIRCVKSGFALTNAGKKLAAEARDE